MLNLNIFVDVMITVYGFYMIYSCIKLKTKRIINEKFMLGNTSSQNKYDTPKRVEQKNCKDLDGYINYSFIRFLIPSIIATLGGILGIINDTIFNIGPLFFVVFLLVLIALGYSMYVTSQGTKRFF